MTSASTVNEPAQWPHCNPHSKAKANYKKDISVKLVSSGISDVAFVSVSWEKTRMKKCWIMIIIIIINKSQETTVFHGRQKLTFAMKQMPEK